MLERGLLLLLFVFGCFCCLDPVPWVENLTLVPAAVAVDDPTPPASVRLRFLKTIPPPTAPQTPAVVRGHLSSEDRFAEKKLGVVVAMPISDRGRVLPCFALFLFLLSVDVCPLLINAAGAPLPLAALLPASKSQLLPTVLNKLPTNSVLDTAALCFFFGSLSERGATFPVSRAMGLERTAPAVPGAGAASAGADVLRASRPDRSCSHRLVSTEDEVTALIEELFVLLLIFIHEFLRSRASASAKGNSKETERSCHTEAEVVALDGEHESCDFRSAAGGAGAAAGGGAALATEGDDEDESKSKDNGTKSENESENKKKKAKFDQTKLEDFPQVKNQKNTHWDIITPGQLVWCLDCPAIVIPEHLHVFAKVNVPQGGVMAYGPSSKDVMPLKNRFAILQFLPVCLTCYATPETPYYLVRGSRVEAVLPYNTLMSNKAPGEDRKLGPAEKWADADHHFKQVKRKHKQLAEKNWNAALEHAQKFLDRALELKAQNDAEAVEEQRLAEEELALQRQQRELEPAEGGGGGPGNEGDDGDGDGDGDTPPKRTIKMVQLQKGLPLAPGDRIFYWDRTKTIGLSSSRREATIVEIRTKKIAKKDGLLLLVLDNQEVVFDDWIIQRYTKDKETGEVTLDHRGEQVRNYKLKPGKLENVDYRRNKLMEGLVNQFEESVKAYGAGDQLRNAPKRSVGESIDDGATTSIQKQGKAAAKKVKSTVTKNCGGGPGSGSSSKGGGGGGSLSAGRKGPPLGEEDTGDAMAASIARARKETKAKVPVETKEGKKKVVKGRNKQVKDGSGSKAAAPAAPAVAGEGGLLPDAPPKGETAEGAAGQKVKKKRNKLEQVAQKNAAVPSKKGNEGGGDSHKTAPATKIQQVSRSNSGGSGGGGGGGGGDDAGKTKESKKRKDRAQESKKRKDRAPPEPTPVAAPPIPASPDPAEVGGQERGWQTQQTEKNKSTKGEHTRGSTDGDGGGRRGESEDRHADAPVPFKVPKRPKYS